MQLLGRHTRLEKSIAVLAIDLQNAVHMLAQIENNTSGDSRGGAGAAVACVASDQDWPNRNFKFVTESHHILDIGNASRRDGCRANEIVLVDNVVHVMCFVGLIVRAVHKLAFRLDDGNIAMATDGSTTLEEFRKACWSDSRR